MGILRRPNVGKIEVRAYKRRTQYEKDRERRLAAGWEIVTANMTREGARYSLVSRSVYEVTYRYAGDPS
jgi:hypothetical protein